MPSTIRDLTELLTVAPDDYILISDTSDAVNRDKRISKLNFSGGSMTGGGNVVTGGFTLTVPATGIAALKSGTPVAANVASWLNANAVQDGGFAISDIARLSIANTFNGAAHVFQSGGGTVAKGGFVLLGQSGYATRVVCLNGVLRRVYGQFVGFNNSLIASAVGTIDILNGATQVITCGSGSTWTLDLTAGDATLGIIRSAGSSQITLALNVAWI